MSDITSQIVIFHDSESELEKLATFFSGDDPQVATLNDTRLDYKILFSTIFRNFITAHIQGSISLDMDALLDWLKSFSPTWLMIESHNSQVGEDECFYFKNCKTTTKNNLLTSIRSLSKEVDLYFALQNTEIVYLQQLINDETLDSNLIIDGSPLLFHLLALGELEILKLAIKQGADIHYVSQKTKWFHIETKRDVSIFEAVKGMNLLSIAIQLKKKPVTELLIQSGIDVNAVDANGDTPLTIAIGGTHAEQTYKYTQSLVEAGADINHETPAGYTPLFLWFENYLSPSTIIKHADTMIQLGADIKHVSRNKMNALWAVRGHDAKVVEYVKTQGVTQDSVPDGFYDDLNEKNQLQKCINKHDIAKFTQLFKSTQPNLKDQYSMLRGSISTGFFQATKFLIENGFPAYYQDRDGTFLYQLADEAQQNELSSYLKQVMVGVHMKPKIASSQIGLWVLNGLVSIKKISINLKKIFKVTGAIFFRKKRSSSC